MAALNSLAGLKEGTTDSGMRMVVFLEMFRAGFAARCLMPKVPNSIML